VYSRTVLTRAIGWLGTGRWDCPCRNQRLPEAGPCSLVLSLTADLNVVRGWPTDVHEQPGDER